MTMTDRHDDRFQGSSRWQDDQRFRSPDDRSRSGWQAEERNSSSGGPLRYDEDLGYSQGDRWGQSGGQFQSQRGQMQGGQYGNGQYGGQDNGQQGSQGYGNTDFRGAGQGGRMMSQQPMSQGNMSQRGDGAWQDGGRSWGSNPRQDGFSGSAPYSSGLQGQGGYGQGRWQNGQNAGNPRWDNDDRGWSDTDDRQRPFDRASGFGQGRFSSQQSVQGYGYGSQGSGSSHQGKGPKGYQRSDDRIRESVNDALEDDHDVDASEIEVQVQGGEVTLTGTVNDRHQKRRAEDVAERLRGVRDVHNQLRVMSQGRGDQRVTSQPVTAQGTVTPSSGSQAGQGQSGTQSATQSGASGPGASTISASPTPPSANSAGAKPSDDVSRR